jgi:hypothetical protein
VRIVIVGGSLLVFRVILARKFGIPVVVRGRNARKQIRDARYPRGRVVQVRAEWRLCVMAC